MAITSLAPEVITKDMTVVYIVRVDMTGGTNIESREDIDELSETVTHIYDKATRQKISQVRSKYWGRIIKQCITFHGLRIARADALPAINAVITEADHDLNVINEKLHAKVAYLPLDASQKTQEPLYNAMVTAIREQVYKILLPRLKALAGQPTVPKKSRLALLDLCDKMDAWNVLGDPNFAKTIQEFRRQFQADVIAPVAAEIETELIKMGGIGAFVEGPEVDAPPVTTDAPAAAEQVIRPEPAQEQ